MKGIANKIKLFLNNHAEEILIGLTIAISISSFLFYYSHHQLNLAYGDAESRLNIARKIIDNLTPSVAQFGDIWLPLPQALMIPFIWSNFMWHTGLAGYFMSGAAFIVLIYFLYKIGEMAFDSKLVGFFTALAGFNINLIYMQSTAMSEVIFITFVAGATYFLLKWAKEENILSLMASGFFISAATLSRYEGYFVFFASVFLVILIGFIKYKKFKKIEGFTVLFGTIAVTGIVLWSLFSLAIFKDAFYWAKIYSHQNSIISTDIIQKQKIADSGGQKAQTKNFFLSVEKTVVSAAWMNGLILTSIAGIGLGIFLVEGGAKGWVTKKPYLLVLLLPSSALLFVLFSIYFSGLPLDLPALTLKTIMDRNSNYFTEYNIRYGMNLLPIVAVFIGYLATKGKIGKVFVIFLLLIQFITTFWTPFFTIYQLPIKLAVGNSAITDANNGESPATDWLKNNYNGGLIMISALEHDPEMFYMGFDYKTYIHEGTGKYWITSRDNPQKYATWILMYRPNPSGQDDDSVTKYLRDNPNLAKYFNLVYSDDKFLIYKIKTHPEIQIKN